MTTSLDGKVHELLRAGRHAGDTTRKTDVATQMGVICHEAQDGGVGTWPLQEHSESMIRRCSVDKLGTKG